MTGNSEAVEDAVDLDLECKGVARPIDRIQKLLRFRVTFDDRTKRGRSAVKYSETFSGLVDGRFRVG